MHGQIRHGLGRRRLRRTGVDLKSLNRFRHTGVDLNDY
jgi:hypothetical protein